eukprot:3805719-Rhodomonas_salina.2
MSANLRAPYAISVPHVRCLSTARALSQYRTCAVSVPHTRYLRAHLSTAHMLSAYLASYATSVLHMRSLSTAHMLSQYPPYAIQVPHTRYLSTNLRPIATVRVGR